VLLAVYVFYLTGYFPAAAANAEAVLPSGELDRGKAVGGRLTVNLGPFFLFGAYLSESWREDVKGCPGLETQESGAWIAGAGLEAERVFALFELTHLIINDYQFKVNGELTDLQTIGGHVTVGAWRLEDWQAVVRWEWLDPNTANTRKTFQLSRFDQRSQWTVGINYRFLPAGMVMVNYVMPEEEGHEVDLDEGKWGGKYQRVENNYFRVQLQLWR
jgi:hypothetical protein